MSDPIDFVAMARGRGGKGKDGKGGKGDKESSEPIRHAPEDTKSKSKSKVARKGVETTEELFPLAPAAAAGGAGALAPKAKEGKEDKEGKEAKDGSDPNTMRQSLLYGFSNMLSQFLAAAATVWPKDTVIGGWNETFNATVSSADDKTRAVFFGSLINGFHAAFKEHYSSIATENAAMFDDERNAWFVAVRAKAKFAEASPQIRIQIWRYASFLARMSNMYAMYSKCPDGLLGHIHKLAQQLGGRMQKGEMSFADLNPMTLGQHLMKVLTPDELGKFGTSMLSESNLEGMIAMLTSMCNMMGGGGEGGGVGGAWGMSAKDMMAAAGIETPAA